jgi:hypothetical protein
MLNPMRSLGLQLSYQDDRTECGTIRRLATCLMIYAISLPYILYCRNKSRWLLSLVRARLPAVRQRGILELNPAICTLLDHLSLLGILQS